MSVMLEKITPVVLTYNEEPNIGRVLERLHWAKEVVVVDSISADRTAEIVSSFPNTRMVQRRFDAHARQWNYATTETNITSDWILALDSDYILTSDFLEEIKAINPDVSVDGFTASFIYCVSGRPLRGTLYPPVIVLYRRRKGSFIQDGHTHRLQLNGKKKDLKAKLLHDDRKPLSHWLGAQDRYMKLEAEHIANTPWSAQGFADKIRRYPLVAPFAVFFSCYIIKRGFLDGSAGLFYALQRMLAEALLGLRTIERCMLVADQNTQKPVGETGASPPSGTVAHEPKV